MLHLLDIVALVIVLACVVYAMRALLPRSVLTRIAGSSGGDTAAGKSASCGGCNNCDANKKPDKSRH